MLASLAAAPPALSATSPAAAYADPTPETSAAIPPQADESVAGPVPLPRPRPPAAVALIAGGVPLPRPRPDAPAPEQRAPDLAPVDRHTTE
jgi:hypothetical protein